MGSFIPSILALSFILLQPAAMLAQVQLVPPQSEELSYGLEVRTAAGTSGETPFWLHSNQHGDLDRYSGNALLNLFGSWQRSFQYGITVEAGGNLLLRASDDADVYFREAYLKASYRGVYLRFGRKQEHFGLHNQHLSMGTVDLSHNARPMPKIAFGTVGMIEVPGTSGLLYADAGIAHGWMGDRAYRFVQDPWLHQKHLYLRLFSDNAPVSPIIGITHFAQWGGHSPVFGKLPVGPRAFRDVFFSMAPDVSEIVDGGVLPNAFQNHVGSYDVALQFNVDRYRIKLTRQFILEDTPNARFGTPFDGMWGASVELRPHAFTSWRGGQGPQPASSGDYRPLLHRVHYAYLDTKEGISRYDHRDETSYFNYYGHSTYRGGWTYNGRAIGNPLFFSDPDYLSVVNNIIIAHHLGASGYIGPAGWKFFTTYSRNYGATNYRAREGIIPERNNERGDQWSFLLEAQSASLHPTLELGLSLAFDLGSVYQNNLGMMLSLRWSVNSEQ
ncbi:MAG: capsule assembly Wzi family protein [Balneolia bacterium]|nr:capsule assembly Wzi family protein [Balneolia bacterium]